jgi:hypothetical protein
VFTDTANKGIALAHRWEPERLFVSLVLTGYIDESGTHGGSVITIMAGALANARQWRVFEAGFAQAQRDFGFRVFHTRRFKNRAGEFEGWSNEKCLALIDTLGPLTHGLAESVVIGIENTSFERDYKSGDRPRWTRLDTAYGLCFRTCLYHFMEQAWRRRYKKKLPELHIILEAGHKNAGDAERVFVDVKKEFDAFGFTVLRTLTKAAKDECSPLMIADASANSGSSSPCQIVT